MKTFLLEHFLPFWDTRLFWLFSYFTGCSFSGFFAGSPAVRQHLNSSGPKDQFLDSLYFFSTCVLLEISPLTLSHCFKSHIYIYGNESHTPISSLDLFPKLLTSMSSCLFFVSLQMSNGHPKLSISKPKLLIDPVYLPFSTPTSTQLPFPWSGSFSF